ncbi:LuxR family transcriptional regulator [Erwinia sp. E602]|uniref:LuxR family transcriptional regulator n=1 Tax=Erwinia sp. E602 TaxID=2675378 RepID=UPI001BA78A58|nr:LuxR family transcriptional regulator [Erwinia sp. E602]QUG77448.1 LuxR family transcriptional regulator [Erwinia sp. E602]
MINFFSNYECEDKKIRSFLERNLKGYGNFLYSYFIINKKDTGKIKIISNYPTEWIDIYKSHKFQYIDPVVLHALKRTSPFLWGESIDTASKIFTYSKKHNIKNGFTFVLHDNINNIALLSLLTEKNDVCKNENIIINNTAELQMLLIKTHERYFSTLKDYATTKTMDRSCYDGIFSTRENEILYWASMGKTYQDISIILDLKVGTVKFHMAKVVKKLGVVNAKHAIHLGTELNIIITPDSAY